MQRSTSGSHARTESIEFRSKSGSNLTLHDRHHHHSGQDPRPELLLMGLSRGTKKQKYPSSIMMMASAASASRSRRGQGSPISLSVLFLLGLLLVLHVVEAFIPSSSSIDRPRHHRSASSVLLRMQQEAPSATAGWVRTQHARRTEITEARSGIDRISDRGFPPHQIEHYTHTALPRPPSACW